MKVTFKYHTFKKNGKYVDNINEVPYWRLYYVEIIKYKENGKVRTKNKVKYKTLANYTYNDILAFVDECPPNPGERCFAYARIHSINRS